MNSQQQKAVETVDGRLLILAGAGSGKTRVLTHRMAHLIGHLKVSAQSILGLTFTNRAAIEMRHRIGALISAKQAKEVTLSTFHSFCLHILRAHIQRLGFTANFTLYNEHDMKRLTNYITRDLLGHDGDLPSYAKAEALIQKAKNYGKKPHEIVDPTSAWHENYVRTLYSRLEEAMRAYNAVDFDHLLTLTVSLFENHPDLLESYQERYRYIMVDEYQDTNPIQYKLVHLLSAKYNNLCVVGDDDQSIYGWRGADMRNILNFENALTIKLEQNYRSTNVILDVANAIISHNKERHQKVLWSECERGELVEIFVAKSEEEEAQNVALRLIRLKENKQLKWRDIAILYRSNSLARAFEAALLKASWHDGQQWRMGVPYQIHGGTEWYEKREVKDLLAYLKVIINPLDQESILRIVNQPRRGIGESSLDKLTAYQRSLQIPLWELLVGVCRGEKAYQEIASNLPAKVGQSLKDFIAILEEAKELFTSEPLAKAFTWLIGKINYKRAIREEVKSVQMREFKWQNVLEFVTMLSEFEKLQPECEDRLSQLADFVSQIALEGKEGLNLSSGKEEDKVQLMTFHSSKGLEFPACFLVGIEDQIIPHERSILENSVEEERRLMYVAVTRAMKFLTISMSAKRMRKGKEEIAKPSPFLFDIPTHLYQKTQCK